MDDFFAIDQPTPPSSSNGLPAAAWVAIGTIDPRFAEPLLSTLRSAGVGAYVAPFTGRGRTHLEMRLWVDAALRPEAERVVSTSLPELRDSLQDTEDEKWASIVASLQSTPTTDDAPWPAIEDEVTDREVDRAEPRAADDAPAYRSRPEISDDDDEDHFVPPDPAPLPPANPVTKYGWTALLGGIVLLVVPALFGHAIGSSLLAIAIIAIIGGFLTLVLRLKDGPPDDTGPDDGAVV
ncbi:MAG: hypothetical protein ACJ735_00935 [Actinomycetes bacterium]